jgi:prolipoprotein diacylglyceryltransferase
MLYWDPRPEIFVIPFLNWPVFWYGVLFGLGFVLGFPLFVSILKRFFSLCTEYSPEIAQQKAFLITDRLSSIGPFSFL